MTDEISTDEDGRIVIDCGLDANAEKVWRALTTPELARDWLNAASQGGRGDTFEMIDSVPFSRVVYRCREAGDDPLAFESTVTVDIQSTGAGSTRFRLVHEPVRASLRPANSNAAMTMARAA